MSGIEGYATAPANNTALFPEGMAPSAVNDGMRQVQADIRAWYNDAEWILYGDGEGAATAGFAGAASFTIAGADVTAQYHAGRRVRATGALTGTIYGTILSSSFATNTTVTVAWDSGSLENEALTVALGILGAANQAMPVRYSGGMTGEIRLFAGASIPNGWLGCDGQAVSRTAYSELFAAIGTAFGAGDGSTTFNLPDLRGRTPIGAGQGAGLANRTLAQTLGTEEISVSAMPSHAHSFSDTATTSNAGNHSHTITRDAYSGASSSGNRGWSADNVAIAGSVAIGTNTTGAHAHSVTVSGMTESAGSSAADGNMQPSLVLNFIIKS